MRRPVTMLVCALMLFSLLALKASYASADTGEQGLPFLRVSDNGRFLVQDDGTPFFYMGEDNWSLIAWTSREEVDAYLEDRASKGFNVIQTSVVGKLDRKNHYGEYAFHTYDPSQPYNSVSNKFNLSNPNDAFFEHVDYIVNKAEQLGMYVAIVPAWGSLMADPSSQFGNYSSGNYGRYLGERYLDKPVIWILGADRNPIYGGVDYRPKFRALAQGLDEGGQGRHLMTFLPGGGSKSSTYWHNESWLDFNMNQSGHSRFRNPDMVELLRDNTAMLPVKPTIDGENGFERIPEGLSAGGHQPTDVVPEAERLNTYDIRIRAYWNVFAGSFGHVYGANGVYQMTKPGVADSWRWDPQLTWDQAIHYLGASQMKHLRQLMEARSFSTGMPDQDVIVSAYGTGYDNVLATRDEFGSYAMVHLAKGKAITVRMDKVSGPAAKVSWYNPRNGQYSVIGTFAANGTREFAPPTTGEGNDWVLVLDTDSGIARAAWEGPDRVGTNGTVVLSVYAAGVTESVYQRVYAADLRLSHDPEMLRLESVASGSERFRLLASHSLSPGVMRLLFAAEGASHALPVVEPIFRVAFTAIGEAGATTAVRVQQGYIANGAGNELTLAEAVHELTIEHGEPAYADVNGDGRVSVGDLGIVAAAYGTANLLADVNGDGIVDALDLNEVAASLLES